MTVCAVPKLSKQIGIVNILAVGSQRDLLTACNGPLLGHDPLAPGGQGAPALPEKRWVIVNPLAPTVIDVRPLHWPYRDANEFFPYY